MDEAGAAGGSAVSPTIGYVAPGAWRTLTTVQRLFSMFPPGPPGLALLLLRVSVALALLFDSYVHRGALPGWVHGIAILISLVVSVGYLTPIAAASALVLHAIAWFAVGGGVDATAVAAVLALDALALALLGPGAYSLDSLRFGRRLVVLAPR